MSDAFLEKPIDYLKGVGPNRAQLLRSELGVHTYKDMLCVFPNRYIDRTRFYKIGELAQSQADVQIIGQITHIETINTGKYKRLVATFEDDTGQLELVWFRGVKWIQKNLKTHTDYVAFGRLNWFGKKCSIAHPELDHEIDSKKQGLFQPIYPSTEKLASRGISNRIIRQIISSLFDEVNFCFSETLSDELMNNHDLIDRSTALRAIHFPNHQNELAQAQYRLKFEELFFIQLQILRKKQHLKNKFKGLDFKKVGSYFNEFYQKHLPFTLTDAQKRVIKEIRTDMGSKAQMNRLLQGDVGSGKTIVALLTMLIALDNNYQATLVAPTEILAQQHYSSLSSLLSPLNINVEILTGSTPRSTRKILHEDLGNGKLHVLIGTHAVFEPTVLFKNLGLAIIDEQHKFGVAQRAKLWKKNTIPPHVLVMTATPIPRTLAMTMYGDLDLSVIDELPPGRKPITTAHRTDRNRLAVQRFIREEVQKGRQVYIVYPLIEESKSMDYKDLMDGYESIIRDFPKPDYQVSIVHGKMKPDAKAYEMKRFVEGHTHIMVATTVIEVGVNVPNASVMIIESAERFGLSQLHQLRGRVGRGADKSYCVLMTKDKLSTDASTRINAMVKSQDGFELAEVDLKLRGPGNLMGTQQSGVLQMIIADLTKDASILENARKAALNLLYNDPNINLEVNNPISSTLLQLEIGKGIWKYIS